jgi:hypothetical protein
MNKRIRALLRKQPNLAEFARKSGVAYWKLYYFERNEGARMTVDVAEKVLKAAGGGR